MLLKYLVVIKISYTFALAFGEQRFSTNQTIKSLMRKAKKSKKLKKNLVVPKIRFNFAKNFRRKRCGAENRTLKDLQ